jgi:hypothetical protein
LFGLVTYSCLLWLRFRLQLVLALADCVIELGEDTGSPVGMATSIQPAIGVGVCSRDAAATASLQSPNKQRKPGRLSPLSPDLEYPVYEKLATVREEKSADAGAACADAKDVDEPKRKFLFPLCFLHVYHPSSGFQSQFFF